MSISIHQAYGGFGDKPEPKQIVHPETSQETILPPPSQPNLPNQKIPHDASHSAYPTRVKCTKCSNVSITRMQSQAGTAAWVWCVLLAPFACIGLSCLFLDSCRDKIHFCNRCGNILGKKYAKVC